MDIIFFTEPACEVLWNTPYNTGHKCLVQREIDWDHFIESAILAPETLFQHHNIQLPLLTHSDLGPFFPAQLRTQPHQAAYTEPAPKVQWSIKERYAHLPLKYCPTKHCLVVASRVDLIFFCASFKISFMCCWFPSPQVMHILPKAVTVLHQHGCVLFYIISHSVENKIQRVWFTQPM